MTAFLRQRAEEREKERQSYIRQDVRDLMKHVADSGTKIPHAQFESFTKERGGMNSYEREELVPFMDDDCLIQHIEYCLTNCQQKYRLGPCSTYDEAVVHLWMPEIIKRLRANG